MTPYISKTREGAKVVSRDAIYLQLDQTNLDQTAVSGRRAIGGPSIDAMIAGVSYPNIQDAIGELYTTAAMPIGGVVTLTSNDNPQGQSQQDYLEITGSGQTYGQPSAIIYIFGIPFTITEGMTPQVLGSALMTELEKLQQGNMVFKTVQQRAGAREFTVDVSYIGTEKHDNVAPKSTNGFVFNYGITSEAQPGYGTWSFIGQETKTLTGVTQPGGAGVVEFYYFKRIA